MDGCNEYKWYMDSEWIRVLKVPFRDVFLVEFSTLFLIDRLHLIVMCFVWSSICDYEWDY